MNLTIQRIGRGDIIFRNVTSIICHTTIVLGGELPNNLLIKTDAEIRVESENHTVYKGGVGLIVYIGEPS